ncbi:MAG: sugar ABC transporter permease [Lachnospiraceae bacterium]|nr:sugar ABC transporter permease [Lachnospiraceae bacterium]
MKRKGKTSGSRNIRAVQVAPYIFIAPAVIYIFAVTLIPVLMALPISFTNWSALSPNKEFVGWANYAALMKDKDFWKSCFVMTKFFVYVPLVMMLGLAIACLLNARLRGLKLFRLIFYSPVITSTIAAAILFEYFFQPSFGLFNSILKTFGLPALGWVENAATAVPSVIIFKLWKGFGAAMLIYLAGLQDVPQEIKEAASIDGASSWQNFRYITLPLLRPAHIYLLIQNVIGVFMIFQETYMLKGPLNSTRTVVNYIFEKGFQSYQMGYACAMSFVLFLIVLVFTMIQYKVTKMDVL